MEIIATVSNIVDYELNYLKLLNKSNVLKYRINCAKMKNVIDLKSDIDNIRKISKRNHIILDIPYPGKKMRIKTDVTLNVKKGEIRKLIKSEEYSNDKFLCVSDIASNLHVNDILWINVGEGKFKVIDITEKDEIILQAQNTFVIYNTKALIGGDIIKNNNDYMDVIKQVRPESVAFSFVENAKDIIEHSIVLKDMGIETIAKIETEKGVKNIRDILKYFDSVMIARGDLALNMDMREFTNIQMKLARETKKNKKKCILATGIGESLIYGGAPSRADLSDFDLIKRMRPDALVLTRNVIMGEEIDNVLSTIRYLLRGI